MLHVADRLSDRGGAYTHMLAVVEELARVHEVTLAVGRREGVEAPCPTVVCPGLDARASVAVPELEALAARERFDLLHLHNVMNPAVLRWSLRLGRGYAAPRSGRAAQTVPVVVTVQDHRFFCPGRGKWTRDGAPCREAFGEHVCAGCFEDLAYFREILALTRERLDALRPLTVIVLSEYMRGELAQAGLDARRVHVIPPFVHGLDEEAEPGGPPCVAFVGRLAESKGVRDAIAAWKMSGVDLPLVLAGTGPLRDELEREGYEVLGWLDRGLLSALYKRSRAVLLPSRWQEPFGIVGPEALAMNVPVVAWDSGGVGEWYRGERVEWGDVDGLARALRAAVNRRGENTTRGRLDRRELTDQLLDLYARLRARTP